MLGCCYPPNGRIQGDPVGGWAAKILAQRQVYGGQRGKAKEEAEQQRKWGLQ